jgi:hypothetical protein
MFGTDGFFRASLRRPPCLRDSLFQIPKGSGLENWWAAVEFRRYRDVEQGVTESRRSAEVFLGKAAVPFGGAWIALTIILTICD